MSLYLNFTIREVAIDDKKFSKQPGFTKMGITLWRKMK